jgi:hypothetical protein
MRLLYPPIALGAFQEPLKPKALQDERERLVGSSRRLRCTNRALETEQISRTLWLLRLFYKSSLDSRPLTMAI